MITTNSSSLRSHSTRASTRKNRRVIGTEVPIGVDSSYSAHDHASKRPAETVAQKQNAKSSAIGSESKNARKNGGQPFARCSTCMTQAYSALAGKTPSMRASGAIPRSRMRPGKPPLRHLWSRLNTHGVGSNETFDRGVAAARQQRRHAVVSLISKHKRSRNDELIPTEGEECERSHPAQ